MKKTLIVIIILFLIRGFGVHERIIDDVSLATVVGYDYVNSKDVKGVVSRPQFNPDKTISNKVYSETSQLIRENRAKLDAESSRPILSGKLEIAFFNKELAEHGLFKYIDYLVRDPDIGSRVAIVVSERPVEDIINQDYGSRDAGIYLSDLIHHNEENSILPKTNLHTFYYQYFAKGMDPYLPMMTAKGENVLFNGMALFKSDKYVGKISFKKTFVFNTLVETFNNGVFPIHNGADSAVIENITSNRKITVHYNQGAPEVMVHINLKGIIREYKGKKITNKKMNKIKEKLEKKLEAESESLIRKFQKLNVDPMGIGEQARSQYRHFNFSTWYEQYPTMKVDVKVNAKLTEFGIER